MKHVVLLFLSTILSFQSSIAQELNCQVTIVINRNNMVVTSVEEDILKQLENSIFEIMNNTKWTKDNFELQERINCQLQLQIESIPQSGSYEGSLQVQSSRPAFSSTYNSLLFNFQDDKISFNYSRNALLVYAPNQYRDNLTSVLAFYAYYILGLDYDSFSPKGGQFYFTEAQNVVLNAQSSGASGWGSNETGNKNNRYWLIDNALHQLFDPLRTCFYEYHRNGIDQLYSNKQLGRESIYNALNLLMKVVAVRPGYINLVTFCQTKQPELKNLFSDADQAEKARIVNLLLKLDPANSSKYEEILK